MDIGPGDFVVCVNAAPHRFVPASGLIQGGLYQVREVVTFPNVRGTGLRLCGVIMPTHTNGKEFAWTIDRFRPIYRPKPDAFADLLKVPACVGEPA